jgi:hypothetical protein
MCIDDSLNENTKPTTPRSAQRRPAFQRDGAIWLREKLIRL